jgi:hypothetical protein
MCSTSKFLRDAAMLAAAYYTGGASLAGGSAADIGAGITYGGAGAFGSSAGLTGGLDLTAGAGLTGAGAGLAADAGVGLTTAADIGAGITYGGAGSFGTGAGLTGGLDLTAAPSLASGGATSGFATPDIGAALESSGAGALGGSFLPVTGAGGVTGGIGQLSPDLASSLGVSQGTGATAPSLVGAPDAAATFSPSITGGSDLTSGMGTNGLGFQTGDMSAIDAAGGGAAPTAGGSFGSDIVGGLKTAAGKAGTWAASHPVNALMYGNALMTALSKPQLPGAAQTALGASSQAVQQAQSILASGGTSSPLWATQKSSIDQSINQNLNNAIEQLVQSAQTSGQGGRDSAVVQQGINRLNQQAETQRQQLYSQALNQIVSSAVSELSGGNQTLGAIAQMQMSQSAQARQAASQTAELATLLGGDTRPPGGAGAAAGGG